MKFRIDYTNPNHLFPLFLSAAALGMAVWHLTDIRLLGVITVCICGIVLSKKVGKAQEEQRAKFLREVHRYCREGEE